MSLPDFISNVLTKLEKERHIYVSPEALEILRKTKSGYNIYTRNYVIIYNIEKGSVLIRSNHYLEPKSKAKQSRRKEVSYLEPENEGW